MPSVLIIKTSSMGDIIHTLPALTDAVTADPALRFDWAVEEAFREIPAWHPAVDTIIPIPWRRFRTEPLRVIRSGALRACVVLLRQKRYDYVIDAQGLIKSAVITRFARGLRCGLDRWSAWEALASFAYQCTVQVEPAQHAIARMRQLFSRILSYPLLSLVPNYGLELQHCSLHDEEKYLLFIHGTSWDAKEWPESYWSELATLAVSAGYKVFIPWGNDREEERAKRIARVSDRVRVLPRASLTRLATTLQFAAGAVSVDTGLGQLAAALRVPNVSLYGPTHPDEVGAQGVNQAHLAANFSCSPCRKHRCAYSAYSQVSPACFSSIPPQLVWQQLQKVMRCENAN